MIGIIGVVVIFVMVFGGYMLAGGKMGIILKSLPFDQKFWVIRKGSRLFVTRSARDQ